MIDFFKNKTVGFYITAAAAILAFILSFVYLGGYVNSIYMSWAVFLLPLLSAILFCAMSFHKMTIPFSALVVALLNFIAFLVFIASTYLYLSEAFYDGVSAEAIAHMDPFFVISLVGLLIVFVLGNIGIYMKQVKAEN